MQVANGNEIRRHLEFPERRYLTFQNVAPDSPIFRARCVQFTQQSNAFYDLLGSTLPWLAHFFREVFGFYLAIFKLFKFAGFIIRQNVPKEQSFDHFSAKRRRLHTQQSFDNLKLLGFSVKELPVDLMETAPTYPAKSGFLWFAGSHKQKRPKRSRAP